MEFWPSLSSTSISSRKPDKRKSGRGSSKEHWSNYPIIDHGGQTAGTLVKVGGELEWRTVHSSRKGAISFPSKPSKIFPCTKPKEISNGDVSLRQRAEQGARFLRSYHPDVDIPFDLIKDELEYDDKLVKEHNEFDPFVGNTLAATYCYEGKKKRAIALAFPTGSLSRDLNISPINLRQDSVIFQPRTKPLWTFDTPICQIVSSAPAVNMIEKNGYNLAVRTYGQVTVFDIRNQITSLADPSKSPFSISEFMSIRSADFDTAADGKIIDMSFSSTVPSNLYFVTERGAAYQCSRKGEHKIVTRLRDNPSEDESAFWAIAGDQTVYGGYIASEKTVRKFDMRSRNRSADLLVFDDVRHVITSIRPSQSEHFTCVSTTSQVIWMDDRFPRQPLLGWRHHRAFDRTLSLETIDFGNTRLTLLGSRKNDHVSVISVGKLQDGPLQCQMPARALQSAVSGGSVTGCTIIRHPGGSSTSFSLLQLSDQGSVHHQEVHYTVDATSGTSNQEEVESRFSYQWFDEIHELEKQSRELEPELGKLASRELALVDLSELYNALFGEEAQEQREKADEAKAEEVYETLEKMPFFWQRSDTGEEHLHTLFDVVFGSGEEPLHEARADFLTGSVLDSARGYRAQKQGRIPIAEIAKRAGWHTNIQNALKMVAPDLFKEAATPAEDLDPYHVRREEEIPQADRRVSEARDQLALDLALSNDVYSAVPMKNPSLQRAALSASRVEGESQDATRLIQAAEKLSLSGDEPPHVTFGLLKPVIKDGKKHYKGSPERQEENGENEEEGGGTAKMPLGVRLLLSEWTVGENPDAYEYVDPYNLDSSAIASQSQKRQRPKYRALSEEPLAGVFPMVQSRAPPTIVTARTLQPTQGKRTAGKTSQPEISYRGPIQTQTQSPYGISQEGDHATSQPSMVVNTQVFPGAFGGRPVLGKKKPAKKRMGGF